MEYIIILLLILLFIFIVYYIDYKMVFVSKYKVKNKKIPRSFDEFKILHLSDWHCTTYGKNNDKLIKLINKQKADIIVATGDFIIRQDKDIKPALEFFKRINSRPIYFCLGNHELALGESGIANFRKELEKLGIVVLDNERTSLVINDDEIELYGLRFNSSKEHSRKTLTNEVINEYKDGYERLVGKLDNNKFNILLMHDPLYFKSYVKMGFDLTFSGHVHGGGIRLFGLGFATPWKNWYFTTYGAGMKKRGDKVMIISRGIGNSTVPIRVFNTPEISVITLKRVD